MEAQGTLQSHQALEPAQADRPSPPDGSAAKAPYYATFGNRYLDRQEEIESSARAYSRRLPFAPKSARGTLLWDTDGREYLDCLSGAGALALGHNHPVVIEAIHETILSAAPLQTLDFPTPIRDRFIDELFAALPPDFAADAKIHFCGPSGSDAIEAAIKLVRSAGAGRGSLLCFHGAYHGMTMGALSLTGSVAAAASNAGMLDVHFLPFPTAYRCPFGVGGEAGWRANAHYIESLLDDPNSGAVTPAAVILEVVQGEGGVNAAPDEWLRAIRDITLRRRIPLVVDEVQTGFGRTGAMFAFQHAGITPDVVVLSKALGGGMPLAAIVYKRGLDQWTPGAHAGTFRGNQLGFAAGAATIRHIRVNQIDRHAREMGDRLMRALVKVAATQAVIGDVRGRGLMIGVEIVDPAAPTKDGAPPPCSPGIAQKIQRNCLQRGLIVELGGRSGSVVRFLPPLIVTAEQVDEIAARFDAAMWALD
ncbi:diaminobutyrate--2-oxoglutarate transaminase [Methylocapsa acidiphila]|uniref:diaminobutyrate--2-oxoglutarate transaminase n=1 Tax=Methylocapsa acidiphila TaxID=133552 RepID=UPI000A02B1FE|nr:diaminobutyrate--2-oxoglutarate transaminase [Methylocapsa acidiphila]